MTWTILQGDALAVLPTLPARSVHCVVTSPPYFQQRDYGVEEQIGLEERLDCMGYATGALCGKCYICRLAAVFWEVARVLRRDGVLWIVLGDAYCQDDKWRSKPTLLAPNAYQRPGAGHSGIPLRTLFKVPARLALSLEAQGWLHRADVVWNKNTSHDMNGHRPRRAHDTVLFLTLTTGNRYDAEHLSVWNIGVERHKEHSAVFPVSLVERMIEATTQAGDTVLDPFAGAGTTLLAADRLGRHAIGIELNPDYVALAERRLREEAPMLDLLGQNGNHSATQLDLDL